MKEGFRQSMDWLHTWSGLIVGWVLFFVFATGTAGYFHYEITRWMQPERPLHEALATTDRAALTNMALDRLAQVAPQAEFWNITLPHYSPVIRGWRDFAISWETLPQEGHEHGIYDSELLNPQTGAVLTKPDNRETGGGNLLYRMHYSLHYIDYAIAIRLVGICTMLMLLAIISGVITHKKIFKDFFTFRPGKGQRSWLDAHNVISVMALPFFLMITYTGLVFYYSAYIPAGIYALYGSDNKSRERYFKELYGDHSHIAVSRPQAAVADMLAQADKRWGNHQVAEILIQHDAGQPPHVDIKRLPQNKLRWYQPDYLRFHAHHGEQLAPEAPDNATVQTIGTLYALHEGRYAGIWLRWLYFISGLSGCAMIATGLILWTVKRRQQHHTHAGLKLVEALNTATIAGLPAGIAAYFWANRLLPIELADRAAWEANVLFLVWGQTLIYAFFRERHKAWTELLTLTAIAFTLLPLINALTTDKHLGITLPAGEWVLAGVDLTLLLIGLAFTAMAVKVRQARLKPLQPRTADGNKPLLSAKAV